MPEKRAYFTPSPEDTQTMIARLLFGAQDKPCISFMVDPGEAARATSFDDLEEVSICPVENISTQEGVYVMTGRRQGVAEVTAKLTVNLAVEPPEAYYSEEQA